MREGHKGNREIGEIRVIREIEVLKLFHSHKSGRSLDHWQELSKLHPVVSINIFPEIQGPSVVYPCCTVFDMDIVMLLKMNR